MGRFLIFLLSLFVLANLLNEPDEGPGLRERSAQFSPASSKAGIGEAASQPQVTKQSSTVAPPDKIALFNKVRYVSAEALNVRVGPGASTRKLGSLERSSRVTVVEQDEKWLRIIAADGTQGWVHGDYTSSVPPAVYQASRTAPTDMPAPAPSLDRRAIVNAIIAQSIQSYSGPCPCPYISDSAGRSCGKRSAWSKPGGEDPICYESDISEAMIARFR